MTSGIASPVRAALAAACLIGITPATAQNAAPTSFAASLGASSNFTNRSSANRCVVTFPKHHPPGQLIVSFGDRRLYHVVTTGRAISYPIAVPRAEHRWNGVERVTLKKVNPSWTPTREMRQENPELPRVVAGGAPNNPMGVRAIYLGNTLYRIHGTDAPWTIGSNVSRGCIRMHNEHVVELYDQVRPGMKVTATWQRFQTATLRGGTVQSGDFFATSGCN